MLSNNLTSKTFRISFKKISYVCWESNGKFIIKTQNYSDRSIQCRNCNKIGHSTRNCKFPINSYGVIIFKIEDVKKYLLVQRKFSYDYTELLRGKYILPDDVKYAEKLIQDIPENERYYILNYDFDYLWNQLWNWDADAKHIQLIQKEYQFNKKRFNLLKEGLYKDNVFYSFRDFFDLYPSVRAEPEWEFPKGKRKEGESNVICAKRETYEETLLDERDYRLISNLKFIDTITGSNNIKYTNVYYVGLLKNKNYLPITCPIEFDNSIDGKVRIQNLEIRKIGWFTLEEIKRLLVLPNADNKINILQKIENDRN